MNNETSHAALQPSEGEQPKKANRRWRRLGLWALGIVCVGALITWLVLKPLAWTEDVLLSDGTVVEIKQRVHGIQSYGEIGGPGGWYADHYEIAANEKLGIKTPWIGSYGAPIIFDKTPKGEWLIVSVISRCQDLIGIASITQGDFSKELPKSPYLEYRYRNDVWTIIEMPKERLNQEANLLIGVNRVAERSHYTVLYKQKREERGMQRQIKRAVTLPWNSNC